MTKTLNYYCPSEQLSDFLNGPTPECLRPTNHSPKRVGFWFDSERTVNKKLANVSSFLWFRVPGFASAYNRSFSEAKAVVVLRQLLPLFSSLSVSTKSMTSPGEILNLLNYTNY